MNWNQVEGLWTQLRGRVREAWGVVTHRHIDIINGQREQAVGLLQRRYGATEVHRDAGMQVLETQSEAS